MTAGPRPQRLGRASVTDRRELRISSDRCSNRTLAGTLSHGYGTCTSADDRR